MMYKFDRLHLCGTMRRSVWVLYVINIWRLRATCLQRTVAPSHSPKTLVPGAKHLGSAADSSGASQILSECVPCYYFFSLLSSLNLYLHLHMTPNASFLQFASVNWTVYLTNPNLPYCFTDKIILSSEEKREMSECLCACELELLLDRNSTPN